jgi:hypothetical protein
LQKIVEKLNGEIWATSELNKGTQYNKTKQIVRKYFISTTQNPRIGHINTAIAKIYNPFPLQSAHN